MTASTFPLCQYQVAYLVWAISSCFIETSRLSTLAVRLFDSQNDTSGAFRLSESAAAGLAAAEHCALISTPLNRLVALNVKSTG
jgi:hypothetical protein